MCCGRYFAANRLEVLLDEDDSWSSSRAREHGSSLLVSQLHVAIQTLWSQCVFPRAVWTNRLGCPLTGRTVLPWSASTFSSASLSLSTRSTDCEGGGDVVGVVTPLVGGVAQAFHGDQVVELRVQLAVQEVEGKEEDRKGQVEAEEEKRLKEVRSWMTMEMFMTRLRSWANEVWDDIKECALCASSVYHVHHASICANVVIGVLVVLCELHVTRVVVVDAVVGLTLGLIAHVVVVVFVVAILHRIFCVWRYTLYTDTSTQLSTSLPVLTMVLSQPNKTSFPISLVSEPHGCSLTGLFVLDYWVFDLDWICWESSLLPATSESNSFIQLSLKEIFGGVRGDAYTFSYMIAPVSIIIAFGIQ